MSTQLEGSDRLARRGTTKTVGCFGRLVQRFNEVTGRVAKTTFDEDYHEKVETAENNRKISIELAEALACVIQPDAVIRIGKSLQPGKDNKHENLAKFLCRAGSVLRANKKVSDDFVRLSDAFKLIGVAEREYIDHCEGKTLDQLKRVLGAEHAVYRKEKKILENRRLEMDRVKHKVQKRKEFERDLATATVAFDEQLERMEEVLSNNSATQQIIYNELNLFTQQHLSYLKRSAELLESALKKAHPETPKKEGPTSPRHTPQALTKQLPEMAASPDSTAPESSAASPRANLNAQPGRHVAGLQQSYPSTVPLLAYSRLPPADQSKQHGRLAVDHLSHGHVTSSQASSSATIPLHSAHKLIIRASDFVTSDSRSFDAADNITCSTINLSDLNPPGENLFQPACEVHLKKPRPAQSPPSIPSENGTTRSLELPAASGATDSTQTNASEFVVLQSTGNPSARSIQIADLNNLRIVSTLTKNLEKTA